MHDANHNHNVDHNVDRPLLSKVVSSRKSFLFKLALGVAIIVFNVIAIALSTTHWEKRGGLYSFTNFAFTVPVSVVSTGWQIAEFITIGVRKERGIHPGAHVGLHLVLWLSFLMSAFSVGFIIVDVENIRRDIYHSRRYGSGRRATGEFEASVNQEYKFHVAVFVFVVFLIFSHFALFVRACIETHRRNKQVATSVAYVKTGPAAQFGGNQP